MKITIESTTKLVHVNGIPARIWKGETEGGQKVHCFITRIATPVDSDQDAFMAELTQTAVPAPELNSYPIRLLI
jgi:hypothetical protein